MKLSGKDFKFKNFFRFEINWQFESLKANFILLSGVNSLSCWTCDTANEADCVLKECQNDQDFACYTEFRSHGTQVWYKKVYKRINYAF